MDLDRAVKFGIIGAIGVILIASGTIGLGWAAWTNRTAGAEATALSTVAMLGIAGTTVVILFLFLVIGAFIDRELTARGLETCET